MQGKKSLGSYYILRKNALIFFIFLKILFHDAAKPNGKKTIKVDIWTNFLVQIPTIIDDVHHTSSDRHRLIVDNIIESVIVIVRSTRTVEDIRWSSCGRNRLSVEDKSMIIVRSIPIVDDLVLDIVIGRSESLELIMQIACCQLCKSECEIPLIPEIVNRHVSKDNSKTTECPV